MKLSINISKIYPEVIFYINWAKKSKNKKVKRKLVIKALKEFKYLSNEEPKARIKRAASGQGEAVRCVHCQSYTKG